MYYGFKLINERRTKTVKLIENIRIVLLGELS